MDGLGFLIFVILGIMFGPPLLLLVVGIRKQREGNKKSANVFYILATTWLICALGLCGSILLGA